MTTSYFLLSDNQSITLSLTYPCKILLKSLSPFLSGLTINSLYTKAKFQSSSALPFDVFIKTHPLTIKKIEEIIENLINQLYFLSKEYNYTFYRFNPKNIIVIDSSQFLYISSDDLMPITNNKIIFTSPFCKDYFISPELKEITSIPSSINAKTIYYSLGSLIIHLLYCFFSIKGDKLENLPIKYTKLYWFLFKATRPNPEERQLLFI